MATSKVYTSVTDQETGVVTHLAPGDEIPSGLKLGSHITGDAVTEDDTPLEPVAGPSQSALTPRQQKEAKAEEDAMKADLAKAEADSKKKA